MNILLHRVVAAAVKNVDGVARMNNGMRSKNNKKGTKLQHTYRKKDGRNTKGGYLKLLQV